MKPKLMLIIGVLSLEAVTAVVPTALRKVELHLVWSTTDVYVPVTSQSQSRMNSVSE